MKDAPFYHFFFTNRMIPKDYLKDVYEGVNNLINMCGVTICYTERN